MSDVYVYATLLEVKSTVGVFNAFGIVTDVKSATKTKGSGAIARLGLCGWLADASAAPDYVLNFKVVDDSLADGHALGVNAFALEPACVLCLSERRNAHSIFRSGSDLPPIAAPGDIVRMHRVKRTSLQGECGSESTTVVGGSPCVDRRCLDW